MSVKRTYDESVGEYLTFDLSLVKNEPVDYHGNDSTKCCGNMTPVADYYYKTVKQEPFEWERETWTSAQFDNLSYLYYGKYYDYDNIYSPEIRDHWHQTYKGYNMTEVLSFDSQDFLLQSDIDLLSSVEFEIPIQPETGTVPEVTEIEVITSPKRKRGTGNKRTPTTGAKRTTASSQYTTVPLPPCKVCGGVATGFHFGVITCEACKVI